MFVFYFPLSLPQLPFLESGYFFYHNGLAKARRRRSLQHKLRLEKDSRVSVSSLCAAVMFSLWHRPFFNEIRVMIKSVAMIVAMFFFSMLVSSLVASVCTHFLNSLSFYYFTVTNSHTFSEMYPLSSKTQWCHSLQNISVHSVMWAEAIRGTSPGCPLHESCYPWVIQPWIPCPEWWVALSLQSP